MRHIKMPSGEEKESSPNGHRLRLREKFLQGGLSGFLDYEIVEILLTLGTPRKDCRKEARFLLQHFKSLRAVLEADRQELLQFRGLGPHNVFGLLLIREVSRRFLKERMMEKPVCHSSREVFDFLYHSLRDARKEKFKVLFLDAKNQILEEKTFFEGTVDTSAVYPREIFKQALLLHASSLIFIHNHPSGDPSPSINDKSITRELVQAGITMQIRILDHIIIGNNRYFSFADAGLLRSYEMNSQE